jgi:hypothetical protein
LLLGLGRRRDEEENHRKGNKQDSERQESQPKAPHTRGVTDSHIVVVAAFVQLYGMPSAQNSPTTTNVGILSKAPNMPNNYDILEEPPFFGTKVLFPSAT